MLVEIPDATMARIKRFQCDPRINDYTWERLVELAERCTAFEAATGILEDFGDVIPAELPPGYGQRCH